MPTPPPAITLPASHRSAYLYYAALASYYRALAAATPHPWREVSLLRAWDWLYHARSFRVGICGGPSLPSLP